MGNESKNSVHHFCVCGVEAMKIHTDVFITYEAIHVEYFLMHSLYRLATKVVTKRAS